MNPSSAKPTPARRRMVRKAAAAVIAIAATGVMTLGPATAAHAYGGFDTCAVGWVCIWPEGVDPSQSPNIIPEATFYTYGYHNLSNEYGMHYIYNNQTGGASVDLCYGYNGTNCGVYHLPAGMVDNIDFTPINSITLNPWP